MRGRRKFPASRSCLLAGMYLSFLLAAVFISAGSLCRERAEDFFRNITFVVNEGTGNSADGYAAWTECKQETVRESAGGRAAILDVTAVCGPTRYILPFGPNITEGDKRGCIVGEETAEKLFGTHLAMGQELTWRNRTWIVRGVVAKPSKLLMVQASDMAGFSFDHISAPLAAGDDRRLMVQKFIRDNGTRGRVLRWDYLYGSGWLEEMIPGRWSDFMGWSKNWKQYRTSRETLERTEKSTAEAEGLRMKRRGAALTGAGCLLFAIGFALRIKTFTLSFFLL